MGEPMAETITEIFARESPFVARTLRRCGVPPRDLEDVTHEVFIVVQRRLCDYDATRPLRPWLHRIAFHTALRYRALARHWRERPGEVDVPDASQTADEALVAREDRTLVRRALRHVGQQRQRVFEMHELEGRRMPEIAAALEIPLNTGYSRLLHARHEFRAALLR